MPRRHHIRATLYNSIGGVGFIRLRNHFHDVKGRCLPGLLVGLVVALIAACQPVVHPLLSGTLPIVAPAAITAGDPVSIQVGPVNVSDGTLVGLVMIGNHGPHIYRSTFENGIAIFTIPGEHTLQPGYLALVAASESARGEAGVMLRRETITRQSSAI